MTHITGGCLCGAVRFTANAEPIVARQCWCRDCQYWGAGSSTVNVAFRSEAVAITGKLSTFTSQAASGNTMHRYFCPACGTPVASRAEIRPHLIFLRGGLFDDAAVVRPSMTIWTSQAPDWACFDPDIPQLEGQPPPAA